MIKISLQPEYIFKIGSFNLSNTFLCNLITSFVLIVIAIIVRLKIKKTPKTTSLQNIFESIIDFLLKLVKSVTGSQKLTEEVFPLIATFFIFIATANLFGLLPGFLGAFFVNINGEKIPLIRSPNSDINTTLALALISVFSIQYFGIKNLGIKQYLKRFFNFTNPVKLILGFFEMISDFTKVLSLSLRLFGNVLAGEVLLLVIAFLVPYFLPLPFMILELFIGIVQALIFATLSLIFIKVAQREF